MSATTPVYVKWLGQDVPLYYGSHMVVTSNGRDITLMAARVLPTDGPTGENIPAHPVGGITIPIEAAREVVASLKDVLSKLAESGSK